MGNRCWSMDDVVSVQAWTCIAIHPCGRNFEYYSEDPVVTGKIGAAMVQAYTEYGRYKCETLRRQLRRPTVPRWDERSNGTARTVPKRIRNHGKRESASWRSYNKINGTPANRAIDLAHHHPTVMNGDSKTWWLTGLDGKVQHHGTGSCRKMTWWCLAIPPGRRNPYKAWKSKLDINVNTDVKRVLEMIRNLRASRDISTQQTRTWKTHTAAIARQSSTDPVWLKQTTNFAGEIKTVALFNCSIRLLSRRTQRS